MNSSHRCEICRPHNIIKKIHSWIVKELQSGDSCVSHFDARPVTFLLPIHYVTTWWVSFTFLQCQLTFVMIEQVCSEHVNLWDKDYHDQTWMSACHINVWLTPLVTEYVCNKCILIDRRRSVLAIAEYKYYHYFGWEEGSLSFFFSSLKQAELDHYYTGLGES